MKKLFILSLLQVCCCLCFSQISIDRQVIGSTGNLTNTGALQVSSTVGEAVIPTYTVSSLVLTQGFEQAVPDVVASFTSLETGLTSTVTNTSQNATMYLWNFGDGSTSTLANPPAHTYNFGGTYNVCLTASNSSSTQTVCHTINVVCAAPVSIFSESINGLAVSFTSNSSNAATYSWNFGDNNNSFLANPNHVYNTSSTYSVCLTVTNACGTNISCNNVPVSCAAPVAAYTSIINGLTANFINTSTNAANTVWYFGDSQTSTSNSPNHVYNNTGIYNVKIIVSNACGVDSITQAISVNNCVLPVSNFMTNPQGLTVEFVSTSTNATGFHWDFGDASSISISPFPAPHHYPTTNNYNVCLIATNGCGTDTLCSTISVCAAPQALFTSSVSALTGTLTNTSTNGISYLWTFGDANATNDTSHTLVHTYATSGDKTVCLKASNACGSDSVCHTIQTICTTVTDQQICMVTVDTSNNNNSNIIVWEKPTVIGIDSFRIYREIGSTWTNIASVSKDSLSEYHDYGANPNNNQWAYKISILDSCGNELPLSLYHYTIHLDNVANGNVVWQPYSIENTVNPVDFYQVYRDTTGTDNYFRQISTNLPPNFTNFTDVTYSLYPNASYFVQVIWNRTCSPARVTINTTRSNIKRQGFVTAAPVADFSPADTSICQGACIHYHDLSTNNPTSWQWSFSGADSATSSIQNPSNICYNVLGTFTVSLVSSNSGGSSTAVTHTITVGCTDMNEEGNANDISIYPNPNSGKFTVASTLYKLQNIKIYNVLGECVLVSPPLRGGREGLIDMSGLAKGIYFVQLLTENGIVTKKVVKE